MGLGAGKELGGGSAGLVLLLGTPPPRAGCSPGKGSLVLYFPPLQQRRVGGQAVSGVQGRRVGWAWGSLGACMAVGAAPAWGEGSLPPPRKLISVPWTCPCRATGCVPVFEGYRPRPGGPGVPGLNCTTVFTLFYPHPMSTPALGPPSLPPGPPPAAPAL